MDVLLLPLVNGLTQAAVLFMIAAGLTLIYGVLGVINFAHGSFVMLGSYLTMFFFVGKFDTVLGLFSFIFISSVVITLLGWAVEVLVMRRMYKANEFYMVLATYAILLIIEGCVEKYWGASPLSLPLPDSLNTTISIFGISVPFYSILICIIGIAVMGILWFLMNHTNLGRIIRAAAADKTMTNSLGVNVPALFTVVFVIGIFLAAFAGGLLAPTVALLPNMGVNLVIQAFVVVVVGGLGNIKGALLSAVLVGVLDSFLGFYIPVLTGITSYIVMAVILTIRPQGLLGKVG
ncbi:branched-chain amino acid ABC transporter permease [Neobacillus rhizophilus]|uniref:Branched-chain amino acid ABC transporter permease n=1 Tax=Neobacillus rhizophilus TaxID=2833579 RepID=A0A942UB81_9BACI|nr:branched-chain amino acid ABC transporter permease [Neobacillus rhizophilus]MBS4214969.1 branched-chain amino acid ABC transporter permease [Neobacillus rhizophilus]